MTNAPPMPWWSFQKAVRQAGLNYTKVAARTGLSRQLISYFASGERRPSADHIKLLAELLNVSVEDLSVDVALATSPEEMLNEIDGLVKTLDQRIETATTAIQAIKNKRAQLEQLVQVPA